MSTGFMDWQQVERESRLFSDDDFSWSEAPRRRRRITERAAPAPPVQEQWNQPTEVHSHFDAMMAEWNANYGVDPTHGSDSPAARAFDLSDPGIPGIPGQGTRRTVVITGRGDQRYLPAPRQRRASELRFHERSGFSPDRAGLWAVLLSLALVIGALAH